VFPIRLINLLIYRCWMRAGMTLTEATGLIQFLVRCSLVHQRNINGYKQAQTDQENCITSGLSDVSEPHVLIPREMRIAAPMVMASSRFQDLPSSVSLSAPGPPFPFPPSPTSGGALGGAEGVEDDLGASLSDAFDCTALQTTVQAGCLFLPIDPKIVCSGIKS
jgi:hypothetical protein